MEKVCNKKYLYQIKLICGVVEQFLMDLDFVPLLF